MKQPVKIRYEQQAGKGAAMFVGMVYFEDGSKQRIADCHKQIAGLELPIEHDGLPERTLAALVRFPSIPQPTTIAVRKAPQAPLWPWKP